MSSKLIKNTSIYTMGTILPKAAQFLLLPLYTRYLSPEDYGIVQSMAVLSTILTIFFTMSIERSIYRLYYDCKSVQEKKDFLGSVYFTLLLNATIILILVLLSKSFVGKLFSSIPFNPFYLYAILTVYFTVFGLIPRIYFMVEQKALKFTLISLSEFLLSTSLIVYYIVVAQKGATGMLLGKLIASLLLIPLFIFIILKIINFKLKREVVKESISFSWPLIPMLLSSWILNLSDRIFIERYSTLGDVGLYSVSYKMAETLLIFTTAFNRAFEPLYFKLANQKNQVEAKNKLYHYNKIFAIVLILGAMIISLFAKEFILILDAQYQSAYSLVPIIMVGVLINQIGGIFNKSIYQEKKTKQIMLLTVSSAVLNILLNFALVPGYGAFGAALSTTVTFTFFFIIKYFYSKKCYFIPIAWKELSAYFTLFLFSIILFSIIEIGPLPSIGLKLLIIISFIWFLIYKYKMYLKDFFKKSNN